MSDNHRTAHQAFPTLRDTSLKVGEETFTGDYYGQISSTTGEPDVRS